MTKDEPQPSLSKVDRQPVIQDGAQPLILVANNSTDHCGGSNNACRLANVAQPACRGAICAIGTCTLGFADCNDDPTDGCEVYVNNSTSDCGSCEQPCALANTAEQLCVAGRCAVGQCRAGFADCNSSPADGCEVDLLSSTQHCGGCSTPCQLANTAQHVCASGICAVTQCMAGFADCNSNPADGCEVDLRSNTQHCGDCLTPCQLANTAQHACASGVCAVVQCMAGFADCNSNPADGCEVDVLSSTQHCGGCSMPCQLAHAVQHACASGVCAVVQCMAGFADCNSNPADGCEVDVLSSTQHCGGCSMPCQLANAVQHVCASGVCAVGQCMAGFADCNNDPADGCEVGLLSNTQHCGGCSTPCQLANTVQHTCVSALCAVGQCMAGFADCNNNPADGCEVDLLSNSQHCGGCSTPCQLANTAQHVCTSGMCAVGQCSVGFADCDNVHSNGCETHIATSIENCGTCSSMCNLPNTAKQACSIGVCQVEQCMDGYSDCDGVSVNGCEADTINSVQHCGGCNVLCSLENTAEHVCRVGVCRVANCRQGFADCNNDSGDGCEADLATNVAHCGACNQACALPNTNSQTCTSGLCEIAECKPGYANCNNNDTDGCEVGILSTVSSCGGCGQACDLPNTAEHNCLAGMCQVLRCTEGFADCNADPQDGCEVDTKTNTQHCGSCNLRCQLPNTAQYACVAGKCRPLACMSGYGNCNGVHEDGCEVLLSTSYNQLSLCGTCGQKCVSLRSSQPSCSTGACLNGVVACLPGYGAISPGGACERCPAGYFSPGGDEFAPIPNCAACPASSTAVPHTSASCSGGESLTISSAGICRFPAWVLGCS